MIDILKSAFDLSFLDPFTGVLVGSLIFSVFVTIFIGLLSRVLK